MYVAQPIEWTERGVVMLDQRKLPAEEVSYTYTDYREVAKASREMVIRGSPAIGVAAAMGVALGVQKSAVKTIEELKPEFAVICDALSKTRPTAVDLFWALERMKKAKDLKAEADSLAQDMEPGDVQFDEESGEGGTVTVDRERDLALSAQARAAIEDIDHALAKIEAGTYGLCEGCGQPIPKARLKALPHVTLCLKCKKAEERR